MSKKPLLIEIDDAREAPSPADAPPVPELSPLPQGAAMQSAIQFGARRPSRLARWFWSLLGALMLAVLSVAAWDFAASMIARQPILGYTVTGLIGAVLLVLVVIVIRELAAFGRLKRLDRVRRSVDEARVDGSLDSAHGAMDALVGLYRGRGELRWARERYAERAAEQVDGSALLDLAERELIAPLDALAVAEVEAAARQVAAVTALVPLALADVVAALTANVRMVRRIAEIYGGRAGGLGNWRLVKAVMTHLVATGAVAVGDDMIGSLAGGGMLAKLSRRFGEGVINGALTTRVGVAAMDVCRPMPFAAAPRPSISALVGRALKGLFGGKGSDKGAGSREA